MKITHIYHSGFLVELEHTLLLLDYYRGALPPLPPQKALYVFVSHSHADHYSPAIWALQKQHPNLWYVLHSQVPTQPGARVLQVECRREYRLDKLTIGTLLSTDQGCAFTVLAEGKRFYHAGDLNWWHWQGEPDADNTWQDETFHAELAHIAGQPFDYAFVPLDPRQESNAWWGFADFLKACPRPYVFPMHYGDDRPAMLAYLSLPQLKPYLNRIVTDPVFESKEDTP